MYKDRSETLICPHTDLAVDITMINLSLKCYLYIKTKHVPYILSINKEFSRGAIGHFPPLESICLPELGLSNELQQSVVS